ncbi:cobalt ECF transporter T component CbiQ [Methanococcoides methylutens]|uniref:Transmembrane component NikQ of energizing module of nickel ECF transporter n=1 Tax=Methanococcoides methylutens MM1 TaxID=1434104 RepID=A0A0E3X0Y8_METMT|nr:cobalt ECF transporter T component CbiQ [Methanococcoides methylutens]AKB85654.1 Transmembrane component NikQ of energizing module of nickel ECF transporter [Methanococcoides methylutens MM1]
MKYPEIDKYAEIDSIIHRFDPRAKIITFTLLIFSFVFVEDIRIAFASLLFAFCILLLSRIPLGFMFHRMKPGLFFVLPFLVVMPFTVAGDVMYSYHGISMTYEGLYYGGLVFVRAATSIMLALTMLGTTKMDTTMKSLHSLKIPSHFVQTLMFSYRFIFVFIDEFRSMWTSMAAKGFKLKANRHSLSIIGNIVGMILVRSYERAERVYHSMSSKGYTGESRTIVKFKMQTADYGIVVVFVGIIIIFKLYGMSLS